MFYLSDLKKYPDGLRFDQTLDVKEELEQRNSEILDIKDVRAVGSIHLSDRLYLLDYNLSYTVTLPSSRSLEPVILQENVLVNEVFIPASDVSLEQELLDEDLVLVVEGDTIDLTDSVMDNILLNLPMYVLTEDEKNSTNLPSGNHWSVLSQEDYQAQQEEKKEANNPFASLSGLFEED